MALSISLMPPTMVSPTPSSGSEGSRTSDSSSITTPVKDATTNVTISSGLITNMDEPIPTEAILDVECGPNKGVLYLSKLCQGSKGSCILFNGSWLTPNEFQYVSGRETAKDWKRSIRHFGKSMKLLLTKSIMTVSPPVCKCEGCRPDLVHETKEGDIRSTSPLHIQTPSYLIKPKSPTTVQPDNRKSNGLLAHAAAVKKAKVVVKATANQKPLKRMAETNSDKAPAISLHDNNNTDPLKDCELQAATETHQQNVEDSPADGASSPPRESRLNNIIEGLKNAAKPKEGDTVQITPLTNGHVDNTQNGVSETSDNEGRSVDVMTPAASSAAALSPSNSSSASPLAASVSASPTPTIASSASSLASATQNGTTESNGSASTESTSVPPTTAGSTVATLGGDALGLAPGILRNMLKIPMDGSKVTEGSSGSAEGVTSNAPLSPSLGSTTCASNSQSNQNAAVSLTTGISQPTGGIPLPATPDRNDRSSPRISTKSPVDHAPHLRATEPKLWSPHDANNYYPSSDKVSATPEKKSSELNGHYVIDHKPYMTSAMTPPALKPMIQKDQERSPKRHEAKGEADRKKDMPVFRMPEAEAVQPKVYAPVTWPPVAPDAPSRKEESSPRRPQSSSSDKSKNSENASKQSSASSSHKSPSSSSSSSSEGKSGHHGSSSNSNKMSASATVTSASATTLSQEAMTAQYHDYLRQPGLYPNLAQQRMDSAEYLAFLRKYYEWYELQQRLYAAYPMTAATGSVSPYASFMPGMLDPRLRQEVPKQPTHVAPAHMSPFIYGIDPRAIPGAVPIDWSKCGLNRGDLKGQTPGPSPSESPSKPSASAAHSSHQSNKQEVNGKRSHAETEAEALDLSVKRRRMEESRAAAEKETMHRDMMSAFGRVAQPMSNGLHAAAAAQTAGMPMAYHMYPGMWDLAALQQGALPGVSIPGLNPSNPYAAAPLNKDHVDPATTHIPFTLPHLTPPCTSLAERERLMSHFRL